MKICLISDRLPWPPIDGRRSTLYSFCKWLFYDWKHEVCLITFENNKSEINNPPPFINHIHLLPKPNLLELVLNFCSTLLFKNKSLQSLLFFSKKAKKKISQITNEEKPNVVIFNMARMGQYYPYVKADKLIFDMDDYLSKRYTNMLDQNKTENILGNFGSPIFGKFSKILNNKYIGKFLLKIESKLVEKEERNIVNNTNATVLVNHCEVEQLSKKINTNKIFTIPNRTNISFFQKNTSFEKKDAFPSLVFHGTLRQHHNYQAVKFLLEEILPFVQQEIPQCHCYIVGDYENLQIEPSLLSSIGVTFTGYVNDVRTWLSKSTIYVSPILSGTGMKTKVLEAMAMEIPLVTTSFGVQGIPIQNGVHCLIRDDPKTFAKAILELLSNVEKRSLLAQNARAFVIENYDEHTIIKKWHHLISTL